MVSATTRNIFEYLCALLKDGQASLEDARKFIGKLGDLSDNEVSFLEGAFMDDSSVAVGEEKSTE